MANNQIIKIYEVRSLGTDGLLAELDSINNRFAGIKKTVASLKGQKVSLGDTAELEAAIVTTNKAVKSEQDLAIAKARLTAEIKLKNDLVEIENETDKVGVTTAESLTSAIAQEVEVRHTRSAAILAGIEDEKVQQEAILSTEEAQTILNAQYLETTALVAEAQAATDAMRGSMVQATEAATEQEVEALRLSERIVQLGVAASDVASEMKLLANSYASGSLTEQEFLAAGAELVDQQKAITVELQQSNAELKNQTELQIATTNSINEWRSQVQLLTKERNDLDLLTQEGTVRQKALNEQINEYNILIKENVDLYQQQKINIGNYPTVAAELSAVKKEMQQLVIAGKQNEEEFAALAIRAQELTGAMAEVSAATKTSTAATKTSVEAISDKITKVTSLTNIAGRLITSFSRMAISFIAFTVVIGAISKGVEYFTQKMKDSDEGITENDRALDANAAVMDKWNEKKRKQVDLLQEEIDRRKEGEQFGQYNVVTGSNDGGIKDLERSLALAKASQETGKNALKDKASSLAIDKQVFDLQQKITKAKLESAQETAGYAQAKLNTAINTSNAAGIEAFRSKVVEAKDAVKDLSTQLQINEIQFKKQEEDKYNPYKAPKKAKDTSKADATAQKQYNDALALLRDQQIEQDVQANQTILDNDKASLQERLLAYDNYVSDKKYQAETLRDKEIANAKASVEPEKTRLVQIQAANEKYQAALTTIENQGISQRDSIIKSDINTRLSAIKDIEDQANLHAAASESALAKKRADGLISQKEYDRQRKILADQEQLYELGLIKQYLDAQIAAYTGSADGLAALQQKLNNINAQIGAATTKLASDVGKQTNDMQAFYTKLKEAAIDSLRQISEAYSAQQGKQIDQDLQTKKSALQTQKAIDEGKATSAAQKAKIDADYAKKQSILEKQAFEEHQTLARKQLAIDFVLAAGKAAVAATGVGPAYVISLLENEAFVALQYATQLAVLNAQKFAEGGLVQGLGSGRISARSNIPTQSNGDSVLATVRPGEVILNHAQQRAAGGDSFFRAIGVPGFAGGGAVGRVQPPIFASQLPSAAGGASIFGSIQILQNSIQNLADIVGAESQKQVVLNTNAVTASQRKTAISNAVAIL